MKTLISALLFLISFSIHAQQQIEVQEIFKLMSKGENKGLKVDIYKADKKTVEKDWIKLVEKGKAKVEFLNNEINFSAAVIKEISNNPINIYSILNEYPDHIELNVFLESEGKFLDLQNAESEFLAAKMFLRNFALAEYEASVKGDLKSEEKILKSLEGELKKLTKTNDKLHGKINKEERAIDKIKNEIKTNELDQDRARGLVQTQQDEIVRLQGSSETIIKASEKALKTREKDLTKLQKTNEKFHKSIDKSEASIREMEREIKTNEQDIALKQKEVGTQKEKVNKIRKGLKKIK